MNLKIRLILISLLIKFASSANGNPSIRTSSKPIKNQPETSVNSSGSKTSSSSVKRSLSEDDFVNEVKNGIVNRDDRKLKDKVKTKYSLLCFLPAPMKSHQRLLEPIIRKLSSRGHNVTLVTPMPLSDPPENLEQVVMADHYETLEKLLVYGQGKGILQGLNIFGLREAHLNYSKVLVSDSIIQKFLLEDRHYDGIIMCVMMNDVFIALHHRYNAPIIEVLPLGQYHWSYYLLGIPYDTSYIVDTMVPFTDHMTFSQRIQNTLVSILFRLMGEFMMSSSQELMDKHIRYPGWTTRPSHREMIKNISLVLINTHPAISYPYPLPPHTKEIAGVNITPLKSLPADLEEFMNSATDGVLLVSMGSHIDMEKIFGQEKIDVFIKYFSQINQKVIWKLNTEKRNLPKNIKTTKWLPQNEILAHKNCRLFISHCGYHSAIEAVHYSVPMVAIPIQGDQKKNAVLMDHFNMAVILNLDNITLETLSWTVNEVLNNNKYKINAEKRSRIFLDQKHSPLDTAIYWTEYVLRHNGAHHLKPAAMSMPWYQLALIDVYAVIFIIVLIPFIIMYYQIKLIIKCFKRRNHFDQNKKEQ